MTDDDDIIQTMMKRNEESWNREAARQRKFFAYRDAALMAVGALRAMGADKDLIAHIEDKLPAFGEE